MQHLRRRSDGDTVPEGAPVARLTVARTSVPIELGLREVHRGAKAADGYGGLPVTLATSGGEITCRYHSAPGATRAVVWVGGAGGGLDGPAGGLYGTLSRDLAANHQIASLRLHYRFPNHLEECVLDTLLGVEWLRAEEGITRAALVGHSFGGAVVIMAGAVSETVSAVVPMSTQTFGAGAVDQVSPRPILFVHGTADDILPHTCSTTLHARAGEPKGIVLYEGARHGLDEVRDRLIADLRGWLLTNL
jgi:fermentation-respiration switch protein FrsA (DUF1100 family)